ncbi:hypothetical protein MPDQ_006686 [Monascus purpureus]|uniref:Uncharacterized protein n=1 Tax=Monascus purpureus TaxID=5098 RepID=A0A507QY02_MONPU|nr:hypothetical protein MPDQ_006686 [Monascus purpureus]BDD54773.1 hypothetical protein MAP00_000363 [Monascus purpureus]
MPTPSRRLLVFQETRNPQNMSELVYIPVNRQGLPICGSGPELPSILELPLRIVKAFTDIFNHPRYRGWAILSAGRYHDSSEEGKFYAVVLEQVQPVQQMQTGTVPTGTGETPFGQKMMTQD